MPNPNQLASEPGQVEPGANEPGAGSEGEQQEDHLVPYVEHFTMEAQPVEHFEMGA